MFRRDLLRAFLGVPAALAAGCGRAPALPPGEIVGAAVGPGHRLRDTPPPTPSAWESVPVVIVGGGVAGLSAAWRLARAGFDRFVLLEIEPAPGGTARAGTGGVVPYPWGAHYLPAPMADNPGLLTLLREMDVIEGTGKDGQPTYAEHVLTRDPHERVFAHGQWHDGLYLSAGANEEDLRQRRAFFAEVDRWVKFRDGKGRRAFCLPTSNASDDAEVTTLDRLSMRAWMDEKRFTSPRLRWLVDYGCRDDYGAIPEDMSAWAGLFYFASRRRAPGSDPQPLLSWPEGNGRLVAHLAGKVREQIRLDRAVVEVIPTDPAGKRGVDVVAVSTTDDRVVGYHADQVIFAAPQFSRRYLLRHERRTPPRELAAFTYGSWMVRTCTSTPAPPSRGCRWPGITCCTTAPRWATSSRRIRRCGTTARRSSPTTTRSPAPTPWLTGDNCCNSDATSGPSWRSPTSSRPTLRFAAR